MLAVRGGTEESRSAFYNICTRSKAHNNTHIWQKWNNSLSVDGVGHHQQVLVVEEAHFGHLQDEEVQQLDEEHEEEFTDAADLQEDGAGQQAQQHTQWEVLRERDKREREGTLGKVHLFLCG